MEARVYDIGNALSGKKSVDVDMVTALTFQFAYPDNWSITTEILHQEPNITETVTLANNRGVEIIYVDLDRPATDYGRKEEEKEVIAILSGFKEVQ